MKIEIGESLVYSWLRHVKRCQIVQTNWRPSPMWVPQDVEKLRAAMHFAQEYFADELSSDVFKKNSLEQLLLQAESDALGVCTAGDTVTYYMVDVAFHESGLNYGKNRAETVERVVKKCIRSALCLRGYWQAEQGEIIFVSPKIGDMLMNDLKQPIADVQTILESADLNYKVRLIANDEFNSEILVPTLACGTSVADTSELFLRSYQLWNMFEKLPATLANPRPAAHSNQPLNTESGILPIELLPNPSEFKRLLLKNKLAYINEHYQTGEVKKVPWDASKFTENSNVIGNLRSRPGYSPGKHPKPGLVRLVCEVPQNT